MAMSLAKAGCFVNSHKRLCHKQLSQKSSDQAFSCIKENKTIATPKNGGKRWKAAYNEWCYINPISHYHDATHNPHPGIGMRGQAVRITG